jgi:hypothetical protein
MAIGCLRNAADQLENNISDADLAYLMDVIQHLEKICDRTRARSVEDRQKGFAKL